MAAQGTGAFRFRERELVIVIMTTLILGSVVALMMAHFLRQDAAELPATMYAASRIAKVSPSDAAVKKSRGVAGTRHAEPAIPVVVGPAPREETIAEAESQEPPVPARQSVPRRDPEPERPSVQSGFPAQTLEIVAAILAAAIVAPLIFAYGFFALLRRHFERFGSLVQIHNAISPSVDIGSLLAAGHAIPTPAFAAVESSAPPEPAGDALFEHLFVETLELQTELDHARSAESA